MHKILNTLRMLALLMIAGTTATAEVVSMTPDVAREKALAGEIILIDIRSPDEWAASGVPDVALLVEMTDPNFIEKINAIRAETPEIPLAFSCRSGNRSGRVTSQLDRMGMPDIIDVVGGFLGSRVDAGWAKRGLPSRTHSEPVNSQIAAMQP